MLIIVGPIGTQPPKLHEIGIRLRQLGQQDRAQAIEVFLRILRIDLVNTTTWSHVHLRRHTHHW